MPAQFIGFSTNTGRTRNYTLRDVDLVKQDILNEIYTRKGERVMMPEFGSGVLDLIMEQYNEDVEILIEQEIRAVIDNEPRLEINSIEIRTKDHLIEVLVSVVYMPGSVSETLFLEFDRKAESVT